MEEKELVAKVFFRISNNLDLTTKEIYDIEHIYSHNCILLYYLGVYYEKKQNFIFSERFLKQAISVEPLFPPPYFHLAEYLKKQDDSQGIVKLLKPIFDIPTLDMNQSPPVKRYYLMDQMRIAYLILQALLKHPSEYLQYAEVIYKRMKESTEPITYPYIETWKNVCFYLGTGYFIGIKACNTAKATEAMRIFHEGLLIPEIPFQYTPIQQDMISKLDKQLLQMFCISRKYNVNIPRCIKTTKDIYPLGKHSEIPFMEKRPSKINIGYLSPDFNKNAVGLFVTSLLKYFDKEKYRVYCYYNNEAVDEFTSMFMSYPDITWINIKKHSNEEIYYTIKYLHKIDILFDLIGHGVDNRMDLIAMKPAPVIINYLGYPDYTHLPVIKYRLVDDVTDPFDIPSVIKYKEYQGFTYFEELIRIPRCYVCYTLFEIVNLPELKHVCRENPDEIRLGIMNKSGKFHQQICAAWKTIVESNPNYMLYVKLGEKDTEEDIYHSLHMISPSKIKFLPFTTELPSYLDMFHEVDICIDTYPYSGTTTTCSSLIMGVPVYTIYNPSNRHVSNVTASILKHSHEKEIYICKDISEYVSRILDACYSIDKIRSREERQSRRDRFLKAMNPCEFMKDFEKMIETVYEQEFMMV